MIGVFFFWVLRSGAPWRDLPDVYGPRTTCYKSVRPLAAGRDLDKLMDALAAAQDPAVQMIDTSMVRVHQHAACIAGQREPIGLPIEGRTNEQAMRQRRETVGHPFGTLKMRMGATHFLMKRLPKVATEKALHVLTYT